MLINFYFFLVVTDPLGDVLTFIRVYNEKYPEHPVFYQGTYAQALNDAKRELKFLAVYLHSDVSRYNNEVTKFCRRTLSEPSVIEYINRNTIFWGCDVATPEGFRVAQSLSARTYPLVCLIGLRGSKMTLLARFEGSCAPTELVRHMKTIIDDNDVWLSRARADRYIYIIFY